MLLLFQHSRWRTESIEALNCFVFSPLLDVVFFLASPSRYMLGLYIFALINVTTLDCRSARNEVPLTAR